MKIILYIFLFFLVTSCNSTKKEKMEIYFFDLENLNTIRPLSCESIFEHEFLFKIYIDNQYILNSVKEDIKESLVNKLTLREIDVRYKLSINQHQLCIDNKGDFILDEDFGGTLKNFKRIKTYISENKKDYIKVTDEILPPENLNLSN